MRRNKRKTTKMSLLMMLLLLGIGFAALTANLKINGTVDVTSSSWDVHFENVSITQGSVTANPAPTSDDTTTTEMTYAVNFTNPGDFYEFTVDMANDGSIDAMIDLVSNTTYESDGTTPKNLPTYLKSTVTYNDGVQIQQNQELLHNTSEKIKVRVEFRQDISASDLPDTADTIVFKFSETFKQANNNAVPKPVWVLPEGKTRDTLTVGDEICVQDQCFNFIKYDDASVVLLAKYNLNVGDNAKGTETFIQSSETAGNTEYGTVSFAADDNGVYWDSGSGLKPQYGSGYPASVYDVNYSTAPDFTGGVVGGGSGYDTPGYSTTYYVKEYVKKLKNDYHAYTVDSRLLTYEEVTDQSIGCSYSTGCPDTFIRNTNFWIDNAQSSIIVDYIHYDGSFGGSGYSRYRMQGVRPVIVIKKSSM